MDDLIVELRGRERVERCRDALANSKFLRPRDGPNQTSDAALCKELTDILNSWDKDKKGHAYAKPRKMPWLP